MVERNDDISTVESPKKSFIQMALVPDGATSRPDIIHGVTILDDNVWWKGKTKGFFVEIEKDLYWPGIISALNNIGYKCKKTYILDK